MMSAPPTLIIGAGVFGASTALHLIRKYPSASVTLLDRAAHDAETRVAASWDWNKVVRADYADITYMKLALEAKSLWKSDPLFSPFYHETGIFWIASTAFATKVVENCKTLGVEADLYACSVEEAKKEYGGFFADADYQGVKEVLVNKSSGVGDAKDALGAVIAEAIKLGVKYVHAEAGSLLFEESSGGTRCIGLATGDGASIRAERVVLCTGAYTPKLLMDSAPHRQELHTGKRVIAAAVAEAIAPLSEGLLPKYRNMPVGITDNPPGRGTDIGCLLYQKDSLLKFWGQCIVKNTLDHPAAHENLSMPPPQPEYAQWDVPDYLKDDVRSGNSALFGKNADPLRMESFRICWEALTPSKDFIISPHSACEGLYVATIGSFHGFKFFPVLGKYVMQMLEGNLDPDLQRRWAWDRAIPPTHENVQWPQTELRDIFEVAAASARQLRPYK